MLNLVLGIAVLVLVGLNAKFDAPLWWRKLTILIVIVVVIIQTFIVYLMIAPHLRGH